MTTERFKHNKKRNTAFLFEALVRELTQAILAKDEQRKDATLGIIKEFFDRGSLLSRELKVYRTILETSDLHYRIAERLFGELKKEYDAINKKSLFIEQSKLINKVNKTLSQTVYNNFVPNYKNLATIYQVLNAQMPTKSRVLLETGVINHMVLSESQKRNGEMKVEPQIDNLTMNAFVKNFNKTYGESLLTEQRLLLNKFVTSFTDNGTELKMFLNEEVARLKEAISMVSKHAPEYTPKMKSILTVMESYQKSDINPKMIEQILKIQQLIAEIKKN